MSQAPHNRWRYGILLGLLPFLLFLSACLLLICEGRCQPHIWSGYLALLSLVLWSAEVILGLLCLFSRRIRSPAITLLLTLMFSLLPGVFVILVSFVQTFCMHIVL